MSKSGAKKADSQSQPQPRPGAGLAVPARRKVRLNLRAALVLGVAVVVAVPAYFGVRALQDSLAGKGLMREVRKNLDAVPPKPDLAVKFLDRYLEVKPGDVEALDLRAKLLAESARSEGEIAAAAQACELVERRDPEGPGRQETRRRLVGLYLQMGQAKAGTAEATARELIARDAKAGKPDARDHRLLARALFYQYGNGETSGVTTALPKAIAEFEAAARLDPGDIRGAADLAYLDVKERKDRHRADVVLDAMLKAAPGPAAHLARYRHYAQFGPSEKARLELERAVKEAPDDVPVRLAAAEDALERNEPATARGHLAALPAKDRDDVRVRFLRGVMELREHHDDAAIANWRQALRLTGGTDSDLTYRLAWVLLQLGRPADAKPLMDQFRRLGGGTRPSADYRYLEGLRDFRSGEPAKALATLEEIKAAVGPRMRGALYLTMAQCYEATRDEPRALDAYRSAAAAQPRSPEPYLNIARLVALSRGPEAAADELRHALAQVPDDPGLLLGLGRVLLRQRSYPALKQVLDRAARVAPAAPGLAMLRADYLAGTGRLDEAVKLMGAAAEKGDRTDATLWASYANGLARQGNSELALKALEAGSAADAAGDHAPLRIARARLLQQVGRGRQAREVLAHDLNQLPPAERPPVLRAWAELLTMQGDRPAALAALRQWSALAPDDPQPALTMLDMALAGGDEASARDAIKALKAIRQGEGAYEYIGLAFEVLRDTSSADKQANLDEAQRLVKKILGVAPQLPQGHLMRGLLLEERARDPVLSKRDRDRRLDDAITAYQKALDNGGTAAIPRIIELMTARNRFAELAMLRKRVAADPAFDRLSIEAAFKNDLRDEAEKIAARVVEADPDGLGSHVLLANVLKRLGRPDDAEEALRDFAKARPAEPGPWLQLLVFQVGRNRREAAGATVAQLVRNVKGERPEFLHAQAYKIAGDLKKAGELFQEALRKWPEDPNVARGAADFYADVTGNLDRAEGILRKALKADPAAGWAARKLALILSGKSKDAKAWEEAARLVDAPADRGVADLPEDRLTRAVVLSRSPDPTLSARAIPLLRSLKDDLTPDSPVGKAAREALTRYFLTTDRPAEAWKLAADLRAQGEDESPDAVALYAEALLRTKKLDEADAQVARLAELEPDGLRAAVLKGRVLAARGKAAEASAALEAAFHEREKAPNALAAAGTILATLMDLGHLEAAERVARREAELRPGDAWMLARVLAKRERTKDALDACREAITHGGSRIAVQIALSLAVVQGASTETLQGADEVVVEALKREPEATRADLLIQRAHIRHLQGNFQDELKIYNAMLAAYPAEHGYLNNWAWTLSESLDKPAEGLDLIQKAIDRSGRFPTYLDTQGVILSRLGRHDAAIKILEESAPNLAGGLGYLHLARAYHLAGQDARARETLERARAAGLKPDTMEDTDRRDLEELKATLTPRGAAPAATPAATPGARPAAKAGAGAAPKAKS